MHHSRGSSNINYIICIFHVPTVLSAALHNEVLFALRCVAVFPPFRVPCSTQQPVVCDTINSAALQANATQLLRYLCQLALGKVNPLDVVTL